MPDAALSLLRRAHAHYRAVRAWVFASTPAIGPDGCDPDRHLMKPMVLTRCHPVARHDGWSCAGRAGARSNGMCTLRVEHRWAPSRQLGDGDDAPLRRIDAATALAWVHRRGSRTRSEVPKSPEMSAACAAPNRSAGSFPGGFRTPAPVHVVASATGRHPKPYTEGDILALSLGTGAQTAEEAMGFSRTAVYETSVASRSLRISCSA